MNTVILHFRGLATHGGDELMIGKFSPGLMYGPLVQKLGALGVQIVPIQNMGNGSIESHGKRALNFLSTQKFWYDPNTRYHLLGHSTGGLIARALLHSHEFRARQMISLTTIATPHLGSFAADIAESIPQMYPVTYQAAKTFGYNLSNRWHSIQDLKTESVMAFNKAYPNRNDIAYFSVVGALPLADMSWPIYWAYKKTNHDGNIKSSDGFVEEMSQRWGEVLTLIELDHLTQIGYNFYIQPSLRKSKGKLFDELCITLTDHWKRLGA